MATRSNTKRRKKEEIAEDWCFVCKEGGLLLLCDHRDCLKTYHAQCVGKDDSSMDHDHRWKCNWHSCLFCKKNAKFHCFCCPNAVCGQCIQDADLYIVRGIKGFCENCLRLALLWEERREVDSDGEKLDFTDRGTEECLFMEYWEIIKKDEHLKLEHLQMARSLMKKGRYYRELDDSDECAKNELDVMNLTNYESWELEADDEYSPRTGNRKGRKQVRKKEDSTAHPKKKARCNQKEFIGWGSKSLIEFLETIDVDTSMELDHYDVTKIIMKYVDQKNLRNPKRKKMILCDQYLQSLLGRKLVSKHKVHDLLEAHLAKNTVDTGESGSSSEEKDDEVLIQCTTKKKKNSGGIQNSREILRSSIPAIVPENIKLVYLKRSLVEELMKQGDNFEAKVIGSIVRIKSDPNNYMQRTSHQLVQVTGMKKKSAEADAEILLQVSNVPDDITIPMLSDSDFTKEECEELHQEMKDGLHKKPTVVELEHKARILREDLIKHWIVKEVALLKSLIEKANEKGWRRQRADYVDRRNLLLQPSEQSRLIQEIPEVIVVDETEHNGIFANPIVGSEIGTDPSCDDPLEDVTGSLITSEKADGVVCHSSSAGNEDNQTVEGMITLEPETQGSVGEHNDFVAPENEATQPSIEEQEVTKRVTPLQGSSNTNEEADGVCVSNSAENGHSQNVEEISAFQPETQGVCEHHNDSIAESPGMIQEEQETAIHVIDLTNDDDSDDNVVVIKKEFKPARGETAEWYCMCPTGDIRGPFTKSILKCWNRITTHPFLFKVWKIGQAPEDATPLPDAFLSL